MEFELRFEWDRGNLNHILLHDVTAKEAEEVFDDPNHCIHNVYGKGTGKRSIIGMTETGRLLSRSLLIGSRPRLYRRALNQVE